MVNNTDKLLTRDKLKLKLKYGLYDELISFLYMKYYKVLIDEINKEIHKYENEFENFDRDEKIKELNTNIYNMIRKT